MMATTFIVKHGGIRLKVKLLPSVADVHRAYISTKPSTRVKIRQGNKVHAFFKPKRSSVDKRIGDICLPLCGGRLLHELVPHEVAHAVIHYFNGVRPNDDEACCTAIGELSSKIIGRIERMGA